MEVINSRVIAQYFIVVNCRGIPGLNWDECCVRLASGSVEGYVDSALKEVNVCRCLLSSNGVRRITVK